MADDKTYELKIRNFVNSLDFSKILETKEVVLGIKGPLKYDSYGQMIWDSNNHHLVDIRGWGFLQYFEDGELAQDAFGQMIVDAFNEKYFGIKPDEVN